VKRWAKNVISAIAEGATRSVGLSLLDVYYKHNGILQYEDAVVSGEDFFVRRVLKSSLAHSSPVLFDVGANVGDYCAMLATNIPRARILAFEPNRASFQHLADRFSGNVAITPMNVGLGAESGEQELYDYTAESGSVHASLYPDVFHSIYRCGAPKPVKVVIDTLDAVCLKARIDKLHFLKIDTEGNELAVLKGGSRLVSKAKIDIIQFEFNEMNVISRTFLRDFYDILQPYVMFRLSESGLICLGEYNTRHEIFKFQNIVAARRDIAAEWIDRFCARR
jgi:FkbM family methyltransferase